MRNIRDYAWPSNFDTYIELILKDLEMKIWKYEDVYIVISLKVAL